ncbi:hypothetical protein JTB14_031925 [Gonioctena quinquepunctata]|nr:hypothetical protein JTB14_031925 [Gonioctena quinquepunctata]
MATETKIVQIQAPIEVVNVNMSLLTVPHIPGMVPKEQANDHVATNVTAHVKSTGNDWFLDSRCSAHLTVDKSNFISEETSSKSTITTANDQQMETNRVGDIQLPVRVSDQSFNVNVENRSKGNEVNFNSEGTHIINAQGKIIATATLQNNLFEIDRPSENAMLTRSDMLGNALLWQKRMGHVNFPNLNKLKNGLVHGMKFHEKIPEGFVCEICATNSGPPTSNEESDDSSGEKPPNLEEDQSEPDFILSRQRTSLPEQHLRRGDRIRRPPQTHDDYVSYSGFIENFSNPTSVEEVLASPDEENWLKSMDREYKAQIDNGTWELGLKTVAHKGVYDELLNIVSNFDVNQYVAVE